MPSEFLPSDELGSGGEVDVDELAAGLGLISSSSGPGQHAQEDQALSPADGYFGRSDAGRSGRHPNACYPTSTSTTTSSQVPRVPDRWVSDPSLHQGRHESDKAREARQDCEQDQQNRRPFAAASSDRQLNRNPTWTTSFPVAAETSSAFSLLNPQQQHQPPPPPAGRTTRDIHEDNNKYNNTHDFYSRAEPSTAGPSSPPQHYQFTPRYPSSSSSTSSAIYGLPSPAATAFPPPHPINQPRRSPTNYSERSFLFSEAPPAYTPSPTSPIRAASTIFNNYQSFSPQSPPSLSSHPPPTNMGRPSESEARSLLVGQVYQEIPESMGGDPDQHDENEFTYPRPTLRERLKRFSFKRQWKMILLAVVLLFLTVGFLVTSIKGIKNEKTIQTPDESIPVTRPKLPQVDADGTRLAYPPYDNDMTWDQSRMCGDKIVTYSPQTFDVEFSASRNLSLFQDIKEATDRPANGKGVKVSGEVVVRRAAPGTPGPAIVLETITNDEGMQLGLDWDDKEQRLYILTPLMVPWAPTSTVSPCVQVRATIWAPADSVVDSLNVEGVHLGVKLLDNLSLRLNSFARLASTVGSVVAATDGEKDARALMVEAPPASFVLDTRFVEVKTMSSAIAGSWPLADYLGLETISGAIEAGVWPRPALPDKPRPAILYARSTSGPINVHEPVAEAAAMFAVAQSAQAEGMSSTLSAEAFVPPRQYGVDLFSMSGTVSGRLAFGYSAKVHTTSGHVTLTLLPVLDQAQAAAPERGSMIETSTTSGTTGITVMDALWTDTIAGTYVPAPVLAGTPANDTASLPPPPPVTMPNPRRDDATTSAALDSRQQQQQQQQQQGAALAPAAAFSSSQNPALRVLSARHTATSANLYLTYPRSWEGYIDCDSLSGKIDVGGKDVQIIKRENGLPGIKQHVLAGKGDWQNVGAQVKVHTTSGKIGVTVAE